jgi:UDP-N-acetylglucosamine enolpyruvyl transferase
MKRMFVYQPETVLEKHEFNQKVVNMQYAFIFLKNLCEGNIEIKQYIHEQRFMDEENKIKSESVDFLNLAIS